MKRLICITAAAFTLVTTVSAYAATWMTNNDAGGQIVLTDRKCSEKYPTLYQMYTRAADGRTLNGCWAAYDGFIHVVYEGDARERTYDPSIFRKMDNL